MSTYMPGRRGPRIAEDITSETFVKALQAIDSFRTVAYGGFSK